MKTNSIKVNILSKKNKFALSYDDIKSAYLSVKNNISLNLNKMIQPKIEIFYMNKNEFLELVEVTNKIPEMFTMGNSIYIHDELNYNKLQLIKLLQHELYHIFLYEINKNIDVWLSEGIACYYCNSEEFKDYDIKNILELHEIKQFSFKYGEYFSAYMYCKYLIENYKEVVPQLVLGEIEVDIPKEEIIKFYLK